MGANTSDLTIADIEEMQSVSNLSTKEIKTLYRRFKKLDKDQTGEITLDDFSSIPELVMNPLASRVVQMFNTQKTKHVNFRQFLETLAPFSPQATNEQKLKFLFRIYDVDEDDFIGFDDLKVILKLMVGDNMNDEQLNKIISKTLTEGDKDEDGKLSKEEFAEAFANYDLSKMSIKF